MDFLNAQRGCGHNREEEDMLYYSKKKVHLWDVDDEIITDKEILCMSRGNYIILKIKVVRSDLRGDP